MNIITIDFETYYARDFSLSKMTTEAYVRSDRFEVIGVAVKVDGNPTTWYAGSDVGGFLRGLDYSNSAILCHNTMFDGAILSWLYNIKPKFWLDTMLMARPLVGQTVGGSLKNLAIHYNIGAKGDEVLNTLGKRKSDFTPQELDRFGDYAINDVDLTYKLFGKLKSQFPVRELMVIDQTIRMYTQPVIELDKSTLTSHLETVQTNKAQLLDSINSAGVDPDKLKKLLMSNERFAKLLKAVGVEPPRKVSPTTGKETWAFAKTDAGFIDLLEGGSSKVQAICNARLGTKSTIEETRTENLIKVADRGKLPIMLNYYGAHTGRFSGGDKLNLQNLPRNGAIRSALTAPEGHKLIACDSSQIEARVLAHVAGQDDLVEAFRQGRDVYSEFASTVYGKTITKDDKLERFVGKTCILGLGYGMGAEKFRNTLAQGMGGLKVDISESEAKRIVYLYRDKNHRITALWQRCQSALSDMIAGRSGVISSYVSYDKQGILLPSKLRIQYPALNHTDNQFRYISDSRTYRKVMKARVIGEDIPHNNWTYIYGGKVVENIVQALARIVVAEQMVAVGQSYPVTFQVHDELIISVPVQDLTDAQQLIERRMSTAPSWAIDLPVACESGIGANYGEAK
ncbi:MAG: putative DNA polymerase [Prokaryotic dsDNA virus sp.]|jgi:DNA polymerase|nr:MAG: putative DNA polymerase [Prokaryotic dsDNA virus sp.]|tara:strand:- start:37118 stop:38992 length:1875 start_codon:yes stop_codon:yes gene_type:complete